MSKVAIIGYESVPLDSLKPFGKNPRRGSIEAIAESLEENAQYRPIVVNKRDGTILAGNHTFKAAQKLKWETIEVAWVDVDKDQAKKIMLADNRTNDLATYDTTVLRQILAEIPDAVGTGYSDSERSMLLAATEDTHNIDQLLTIISPYEPQWHIPESEVIDDEVVQAEKRTAGEKVGGVTRSAPEVDDVIRSLDSHSSELEGILELKETMVFPITNYWGIPQLGNRFVESLPENLITWAGDKVTPDDGESWYLYNYGVDSAQGLPWERTILGFYTHDVHFENWWRLPAHYVTKMINAGIKYAISPNFSLFGSDPRAIHLWNTYRTRWLARYMQEAGIAIIPDVTYPDMDGLEAYSITGIPEGVPTICIQVQTIRRHKTEDIEYERTLMTAALKKLSPQNVIIYGGKTGHGLAMEVAEGFPEIKFLYQDNRATMRRGVVFDEAKGYNITKSGERIEDVEEREDVVEEEGVQSHERHRGGVPHDQRVDSF